MVDCNIKYVLAVVPSANANGCEHVADKVAARIPALRQILLYMLALSMD